MRESKRKTALGVASREWNNIRTSLALCGDIGDFSADDFIVSDLRARAWGGGKPPLALIDALEAKREMGQNLEQPYCSISASRLYLALGIAAGQRLGFDAFFAALFGDGLAIVRSRLGGAFGNCAFEEAQFEQAFDDALNLRKNGNASVATMATLFAWRWDDVDVQRAFRACFDLIRDWIENPVAYQKARGKFWSAYRMRSERD